MVEIVRQRAAQTAYKDLQTLLREFRARREGQMAEKYQPKGREIHDTVEISGGGKIVNVARGLQLAEQVRNEKDPDKVRELLKTGQQDIRRIGRLFGAVLSEIRAVFRR